MKKVLFICTHNSGRSQMAEAIFNKLAKGRARAISAGTEPDEKINPTVARAMRESGFSLSRKVPKKLTPEMFKGVEQVITMGCGAGAGCPVTPLPAQDWKLPDPKGENLNTVRQIRDVIQLRVIKLLQSLGIWEA